MVEVRNAPFLRLHELIKKTVAKEEARRDLEKYSDERHPLALKKLSGEKLSLLERKAPKRTKRSFRKVTTATDTSITSGS